MLGSSRNRGADVPIFLENFFSIMGERLRAMRKSLQWVGSGLSFLGVIFLVLQLRENADRIDIGRLTLSDWITIVGLTLAYTTANALLALAWRNLLIFSGQQVTRVSAIHIYGVAQIAKYVPGNVFHIAGRQVLGLSAKWAGVPVAWSAVWEIALLAFLGALFALLAAPLFFSAVSQFASSAVFAAVLALVWLTARRFISRWVATAMIQQAIYLFICAITFSWTLALIIPTGQLTTALQPAIWGAFIVAWLAGFLTPGAPAGIGVREFILALLLAGVAAPVDILFAIVLVRTINVVGDFLFYSIASMKIGYYDQI